MDDCGTDVQEPDDFTAGIFLVDKPRGVTSFSVVRQVRRLLGIKKVGHAGTLDPFATGLLIICAGRPATRLIERFMAGTKIYRALLQLGQETETLDPEGEVFRTSPVPELTGQEIRTCLGDFTGRQQQVPPRYSAAKYKGKPLYHYARKGIDVVKEPKEIEIFSIDFNGYDAGAGRIDITVACSRGTYIRVLAADIGEKIGCGAHLVELRRLGSGMFSVADSLPGESLLESEGLQALLAGMITVDRAVVMLDAEDERTAAAGQEPVEAGSDNK
ncbi:MAG: tRNA pseudouridine(55) synthase TruB [Desulfobulbaceae bacterium]|nr:tRNA pseudouridine(55) synthase TruB [Desulfobulbaceae bacterium]